MAGRPDVLRALWVGIALAAAVLGPGLVSTVVFAALHPSDIGYEPPCMQRIEMRCLVHPQTRQLACSYVLVGCRNELAAG